MQQHLHARRTVVRIDVQWRLIKTNTQLRILLSSVLVLAGYLASWLSKLASGISTSWSSARRLSWTGSLHFLIPRRRRRLRYSSAVSSMNHTSRLVMLCYHSQAIYLMVHNSSRCWCQQQTVTLHLTVDICAFRLCSRVRPQRRNILS